MMHLITDDQALDELDVIVNLEIFSTYVCNKPYVCSAILKFLVSQSPVSKCEISTISACPLKRRLDNRQPGTVTISLSNNWIVKGF